jgi:drug/metabolite transporter (DMT)-like permease
VPGPELVLLAANVVYGTSYVVARLALADVGPMTLAFARLLLGAAVLAPLVLRRRAGGRPPARGDRRAVFWMGAFGFTAAMGLSHWGLALSTAVNGALLIAVEPVTLVVLSPLLLGERLTRRELAGTVLALGGATVVVVNGLPGVTVSIVPHWRGDVLLLLSGMAYAAYSLIGRPVLARLPSLPVTVWSLGWGLVTMVPLVGAEWLVGRRPVWTAAALWSTLYLGVVITGMGYLVWNWALERVAAPRAAISLNVQPLVGALLGVLVLGEPLSAFILAGGTAILAGLWLALTGRRPR